MTQDESFPGRPRGRRARQDHDSSEWQGYDAAPQEDQREFPDLAPIRPREARSRDGRGLPGQHARPGQPGRLSQPGGPGRPGGPGQPGGSSQARGSGQPRGSGQQGRYGSYPGPGRQGGGGQVPPDRGYGGDEYAGGGYPGREQAGQSWGGQQPWSAQQAPQPVSQHGGRRQQVAEPPQEWQRSQTEETPSWAEPDSMEEFSERWRRRGREARREEQQAGQRKRRRLLIGGGVVVALAIAVTVYLMNGGPGAANLGFGNFVTNFLPGELQQVPNPCTTVPSSTLNQYLPGKPKEAAPPLNSGANTECTWTLDSPPTYRVLDVQLQAYSPSGLASGNGSATFAAQDAFQTSENGFTKPDPKSGQSPATVKDLTGMPGGSDTSAFQATQVTDRGGATIDVANVLVRYRNVIVRVVVNGLNQDTGGKKYTASMSDLIPAATTVANEMTSQLIK